MALFKGDVLIAGTNPSGGGGGSGGHVIQDSTGTEYEQEPALQFIGATIVDDDVNEATQVITPSFREIQGDIPDTPVVCLDGAPIGTITQYGAPISTLDANWLPCLGQAVSRTLYHELFEKIGTIYGSGDGSTTFNLPNYGGRVPVGLAEGDADFGTLGDTLGEKTHTLTASELPSQPNYWAYAGGNFDWPLVSNVGLGTQTSLDHYVNVGGSLGSGNTSVYEINKSNARKSPATHDVAHNNIQPSIVANYIIKAKQASTSVLQGTINNTYNNEINEVYSSSYINSNFSESFNLVSDSSEVKVGYQVDGKDVYAKRITFTTLNNENSKSHGLSNFTLLNWEGITLYQGTYRKVPYSTTNVYYLFDIDSTNVSFHTNTSLSGMSGSITLYYIYNS